MILNWDDGVCRPLPRLVAPVLKSQLQELLGCVCTVFPPAKACLDALAGGFGLQPGAYNASRPLPAALAQIRDEYDDEEETDGLEGGSSHQF